MIIKVNFEPEGSATPNEFIADFGSGYSSDRGYGWVTQSSVNSGNPIPIDISSNTRDRESDSGFAADTLIHLQYPEDLVSPLAAISVKTPAAWEYDIDNGSYYVTVGVGDPDFTDSSHTINVEGESVISDFVPTEDLLFSETTSLIEVTDGRLTIDAIGGDNTKLTFVEITPESDFDSGTNDSNDSDEGDNGDLETPVDSDDSDGGDNNDLETPVDSDNDSDSDDSDGGDNGDLETPIDSDDDSDSDDSDEEDNDNLETPVDSDDDSDSDDSDGGDNSDLETPVDSDDGDSDSDDSDGGDNGELETPVDSDDGDSDSDDSDGGDNGELETPVDSDDGDSDSDDSDGGDNGELETPVDSDDGDSDSDDSDEEDNNDLETPVDSDDGDSDSEDDSDGGDNNDLETPVDSDDDSDSEDDSDGGDNSDLETPVDSDDDSDSEDDSDGGDNSDLETPIDLDDDSDSEDDSDGGDNGELETPVDSDDGDSDSEDSDGEDSQIIRVNFTPASVFSLEGYIQDIGGEYDDGQGYGWITQESVNSDNPTPIDISPNTRDRNSIQEEAFNSLIHLQYSDDFDNPNSVNTPAAWEYELANGEYTVTVSVGDPDFVDSNHVINIEGNSVISGFVPTQEQLFAVETTTVEVTDGRLTIDAIGGENTKLNFVEITTADGSPIAETPIDSTPTETPTDSPIPVEGGGVVETVEPIEGGFNVNFGIAAANLSSEFTQDVGAAYSQEQGYGWVTQDSAGSENPTPIDVFANARGRDTLFNDGQGGVFQEAVKDSLIHLQYPTGLGNSADSITTPVAWEYAVENGQYQVTVGVGDPDFFNSNHVINIEGESAISGFVPTGSIENGLLPLGAQAFADATVTVEVTDGRLTVDAIGGDNTKLNYISILEVEDI